MQSDAKDYIRQKIQKKRARALQNETVRMTLFKDGSKETMRQNAQTEPHSVGLIITSRA